MVIEDAFDVNDFRVLSVRPNDLLIIRVKDEANLEPKEIMQLGQKVKEIMDELHGKGAIKIMMISDSFSFDVIRAEQEAKFKGDL